MDHIEKLDDVQLAIYLAQKNYQGQNARYITDCADQILDWIKDARQAKPKKKKEVEVVKPLNETERLIQELRSDMMDEIRNLDNKKVDHKVRNNFMIPKMEI